MKGNLNWLSSGWSPSVTEHWSRVPGTESPSDADLSQPNYGTLLAAGNPLPQSPRPLRAPDCSSICYQERGVFLRACCFHGPHDNSVLGNRPGTVGRAGWQVCVTSLISGNCSVQAQTDGDTNTT